MVSVAVETPQNVVVRVANLPLVSSTYDMVSSVYVNTKENHPYLRSVCEVAEKGVKTITAVAFTSAMPIFQKLEPQIVFANNYACIGLDKIEEKLPILHQPRDEVVANAKEVVTGAKEVVSSTVTGAKQTVAHTISGVVDKTKEAVHESMEMTKSVVNGGVNTVLGSRVVQMVSSGVDTALAKSEFFVDHYLPLTEDELAKEVAKVEGFEAGTLPNYYVRLGSLSSKVRKRAYQQALSRVRDAKQRSQEAIAQLHYTVDLMAYATKNMDNVNQKFHDAQEKLYNSWMEWQKMGNDDAPNAEHIESRTLAIARNLTQQLQTTCLTLVSNIHGLPQNIQEQAQHISKSATEVYRNFRSAASFQDVSDQVLTTSKARLSKMRDSLDVVMDYLVNNTPLNWLVGPFYPQLSGSQDEEQKSEMEMEAIQEEEA
ncbi:perilipin-2 isoform X2 [Latimeria chalumnae]|uniref:perilipin-2 isoform X2 n=1 Tax=Latimeria chalumnae TaxID=7897 RepID=UPI0003C1925E|nr:PREDICTED: perilipin-2 isoform X2 [Latimeria chalumnae]|eukprot:XP_006003767.1 PREDICTED: perilipin-2 isoform X2 [Latimeria chalumnae]